MVRIKRNTGIPGSLGSIKIHVDDEQVATIKQNQNIEVELPTAEAKIAVSQAGVRSNELDVKEGQVIEITTRSWTYISLILLFILIASLNVFLPPTYRIVVPIILAILYLGIYFFVNGFELKVIYP